MPPLLKGKAAQVNLVLEEGTLWDPTFHNLAEGAVDQDGEHVPFEEYSVAYLTIATDQDGVVLLTLGPDGEGFDGTCEVDADEGLIVCALPPTSSIDLNLEPPRYAGWYNLVIYPGGDPDRATRFAEGVLILSRRGSVYPPEIS